MNRLSLVLFVTLITVFGIYNNGQCMWNALGNAAEGIARGVDHNIQAQIRINARLAELRQQFADMPPAAQGPAIAQARNNIARQIAELEFEQGLIDGVNNMGKKGLNLLEKRVKLGMDKEKIRAKGEAEGVARAAQMKAFIESAIQPRNIAFLAGATLAVAGVYYSTKLAYEYALATIGKPTLVRETSRGSILGSIKQDFTSLFGYDEEVFTGSVTDIVLTPDAQAKVLILADDTKETRQAHLPFQNVLVYGPPGTGKTEFAKNLSYASGTDYAILSAADFSQFRGGEAVAELHKLFDWAETCENGLILFIDEADAAFRDRATLDKDGVNLVNAFLSRTGGSSDKFMIILATNYEDELDAAVRSRIHKKLPFLLPGLEERFLILKKKMDKYLFNDKRTFIRDDQELTVHLSVASDINDEYIESLAQKLDGFSGRDIDYMVSEVRLRAYRSGKNLVTKEIVDDVAANKKAEIEKDKQTTQYQRERQNAARTKITAAAAA